jgi:hypothetical protein
MSSSGIFYGNLLFLLLLLQAPCTGQVSVRPQVLRTASPETRRDAKLESAIRRELGDDRYSYAYNRVSLSNASLSEVLVYLPGMDYCGSGGCTTLIFALRGGEYRLISRLSLTRTPIVVSSHTTKGWKDLIVFVSGGGIQRGYFSVLPFDGQKYPENPTVEPALPLRAKVTGVAYLAGADKPGSDIVISPRR